MDSPEVRKNTIRLVIVTPYRKFYEGDVTSVVVTTIDGQIGFMAGHHPLIVAISPCVSHFVDIDGQYRYFTLSEGYCEVSASEILIICNAAEFPEDLSPRRTCQSHEAAIKAMKEASGIENAVAREVSVKQLDLALERARARRHLLEEHGSDHQKERISVLAKEFGWD